MTVDAYLKAEGGEEASQRREFIALTGAAALTASAPEPRLSGSMAGLREALQGPPCESMCPLPQARRALLIKVRMLGLAWVAADRAMAAARVCGNPLAIGVSTRNLVGLSHREHDYRAAKHMADTGIGRLLPAPHAGVATDAKAERGPRGELSALGTSRPAREPGRLFKGSEGRRVLPMLHADGGANVAPRLLPVLSDKLGVQASAEDHPQPYA